MTLVSVNVNTKLNNYVHVNVIKLKKKYDNKEYISLRVHRPY